MAMNLHIVTPTGYLLYTGTDPKTRVPGIAVDEVVLPGSQGELGILSGHLPLLTRLKPGVIVYRRGDNNASIAVSGGFAEVRSSSVIVLAETAEQAGDIDGERADSSRQRAEERLKEMKPMDDESYVRAMASLERALARLQAIGRDKGK